VCSSDLITNSLKHAFPNNRSGVVVIEFRRREGTSDVLLAVSDDGVGSTGKSEGLPSSVTMGTTLLKALSEQLNATVTSDSSSGTHVSMVFSLV
jgi:two-component sensor histidine kinase